MKSQNRNAVASGRRLQAAMPYYKETLSSYAGVLRSPTDATALRSDFITPTLPRYGSDFTMTQGVLGSGQTNEQAWEGIEGS